MQFTLFHLEFAFLSTFYISESYIYGPDYLIILFHILGRDILGPEKKV